MQRRHPERSEGSASVLSLMRAALCRSLLSQPHTVAAGAVQWQKLLVDVKTRSTALSTVEMHAMFTMAIVETVG